MCSVLPEKHSGVLRKEDSIFDVQCPVGANLLFFTLPAQHPVKAMATVLLITAQ